LEKISGHLDEANQALNNPGAVEYVYGKRGIDLESKPSIFEKDFWFTDPSNTDFVEDINTQGFFQRKLADYIDYFAPWLTKGQSGRGIYDVLDLARSKKAARMSNVKQFLLQPVIDLVAEKGWDADKVSDWLAARHIALDDVNRKMAEDNSLEYAKDLEASFETAKNKATSPASKQKWQEYRKEIEKGRKNIVKGLMADGSLFRDANDNPIPEDQVLASQKRAAMYALVDKYSKLEPPTWDPELEQSTQDIRASWDSLKAHGAGFTKEEAQALYNEIKDDADFQKLEGMYDRVNQEAIKELVNGKLITQQEADRMQTKYGHYAPLRRAKFDFEHELGDTFLQGTGPGRQARTRKGSVEKTPPVHTLQNSFARLDSAIAAAERNLAHNYIYDQIKGDYANWEDWFEKPTDKELYNKRDENGFLIERQATPLDPRAIYLVRKGKRLFIKPKESNERAMQVTIALNNLHHKNLDGPLKVFSYINNFIRWVVVSASPPFLFANLIRDPFTAAYNLASYEEADGYIKTIFGEYKNSFKALKKVFVEGNRDPNDPLVQAVVAWESAGGRISFVESLREMDTSSKSMEEMIRRRQGQLPGWTGIKGQVQPAGFLIKQGKAALDWIENANIAVENIMRLSAFTVLTRAKDQGGAGLSAERAARISKDITTNFTRKGFKTQTLGTWWLFFNATVQGNYQVVRNMMRSKKLQGLVYGTIAFSAILDTLARAMSDDDDDDGRSNWDSIPEWEKERNIHFPVSIDGKYMKIPAPWVFNVFWRTGQMLSEAMAGQRTMQSVGGDFIGLTLSTFNPVGTNPTDSVAQAISPTALDPLVQIWENKNFVGNPLGPEGFPGPAARPDAYLAWQNTPDGYKYLAEQINLLTGGSVAESGLIDLRPSTYKVLTDTVLGSAGRFLMQVVGFTEDKVAGEETRIKDTPVLRQFLTDAGDDPLETQMYHEHLARVLGAEKAERLYREGPERDLIRLQELRTERSGDLALVRFAKDAERQLKDLRKQLRQAEALGQESRAENLKLRMDQVRQRFNQTYAKRIGS